MCVCVCVCLCGLTYCWSIPLCKKKIIIIIICRIIIKPLCNFTLIDLNLYMTELMYKILNN